MTISVRSARYDSDERELTDVLQMNLPYRPHAHYFRWLYRDNPSGEALAWVATDPGTNKLVGAAAAFPRLVYCDGREARGYVLGDFCIHPRYRSLGLALALQRACLDGLSAADADFAFDFPSQGMLAIYSRLHIPVNEVVVRHVRPLRADRQIEKAVPVPVVARGLTAMINACLRCRDNAIARKDDWIIAPEQGPWGEEFTGAALRWSPAGAVTIARTADYLNWRYRKHPQHAYWMLGARRRGNLGGYLIYHANGNVCIIDDLVAEDRSAYRTLLMECATFLRKEGIHTISMPWPLNDPGRSLLRTSGFRARESSPAVVLPFDRQTRQFVGQAHITWYLCHGDWEV